jgi:hypothetical protein
MHVSYQSPVAGAHYLPPGTNIILRLSDPVDARDLSASPSLRVVGSASGAHTGSVVLSDDRQTVLFNPDRPFAAGETVTADLLRGIRSTSGERSAPFSFSFTISRVQLPQSGTRSLENEIPPDFASLARPNPVRISSVQDDTLPLDYPYVNIDTNVAVDVSPGRLFLSNFRFFTPPEYVPYLLILESTGAPVFYRKMPSRCTDFKLQKNGLLTYFEDAGPAYYAMDTSYTVVDSFKTVGYETDIHELQLLPNGHALLMAYDVQQVDMSQVVAGGNPAAQVTGLLAKLGSLSDHRRDARRPHRRHDRLCPRKRHRVRHHRREYHGVVPAYG